MRERLLLYLSRDVGGVDYSEGSDSWAVGTALENLCSAFPDFLARITDREVLDFGCGLGYQVVEMALRGASHVVGIDSSPAVRVKASALAALHGLSERVEFAPRVDSRLQKRFDVVVSQNSMEHFPNPLAAVQEMTCALRPGGVILMTFGPPWFAPYGSHMHFFTKIPWVNLLFPEQTVMSVRARFRSDGASHYEEVEHGLNRMTVAKFERIVATTELRVEDRRYRCVKGLDRLAHFPIVRELFVNNISCMLMKVPQNPGQL